MPICLVSSPRRSHLTFRFSLRPLNLSQRSLTDSRGSGRQSLLITHSLHRRWPVRYRSPSTIGLRACLTEDLTLPTQPMILSESCLAGNHLPALLQKERLLRLLLLKSRESQFCQNSAFPSSSTLCQRMRQTVCVCSSWKRFSRLETTWPGHM